MTSVYASEAEGEQDQLLFGQTSTDPACLQQKLNILNIYVTLNMSSY